MSAHDRVVAALEAAGCHGQGSAWTCPAHDDGHPSLSVGVGDDGRVLLYCHAGCDLERILAPLGLGPRDLFDGDNGASRIVATYPYVDEDARLLFEVVRFWPKDFRQRRPDGDGLAWNTRGVRRVLYRLPEVTRAIDQLETVYVAEGEKDADRLVAAGQVATTNPGGAGKWRREYTNLLFTAHVVIVADRDTEGRKHARKVAAALKGTAASVQIVEPATGKDISDHFAAGFGVDDLVPVIEPEPGHASADAHTVTDGDQSQPEREDTYDDVPEEPLGTVLDDLRDWLSAHVAYQFEHHAPTVALWAAHTHATDRASSTPRLAFESPEPESGKTRNLELLEPVVRHGRLVLQMSAASVYRWVASLHPTVLLDEVDAVFGPKAKGDHEDLRAIINAGHRRSATVPRVEVPSMRVVEFSCYCPVALAGLAGALPDTVRSRAIRIPMRRRAPDEIVDPFTEAVTRPEGDKLRRRIEAWMYRHRDQITLMPELPAGVTDRQADQWWPLVAIADAAGGHWPETARDACEALVADARGDTDDQSLGIRLLADIRDAFGNEPELFTRDLLAKLHALDESPWGDFKGFPINARFVARRLKPYGARPQTVWVGGESAKGYRADDLHEAWSRYLPPIRQERQERQSPARDLTGLTDLTDGGSDSDDDTSATDREQTVAPVCPVCGGLESDHAGALHAFATAGIFDGLL